VTTNAFNVFTLLLTSLVRSVLHACYKSLASSLAYVFLSNIKDPAKMATSTASFDSRNRLCAGAVGTGRIRPRSRLSSGYDSPAGASFAAVRAVTVTTFHAALTMTRKSSKLRCIRQQPRWAELVLPVSLLACMILVY
jgi:hypothetical protein